MLQYTTGKLPLNFFVLGILLLLLGLVALFTEGAIGIIALLLATPLLFTRSGLQIDGQRKLLRTCIQLFVFKRGKWIAIDQAKYLQIIRVRETTGMAVLSIARNESNLVYKLILVLPQKKIELLSGEDQYISQLANEISEELKLEVLEPTHSI
ncbi:hypothetical protein [Labilibaculum sp.]|uniref:hypothetical protein n=1 Tax=Labilibaculum sp. TaxID=2060723 RepID=UPI0035670AC3